MEFLVLYGKSSGVDLKRKDEGYLPHGKQLPGFSLRWFRRSDLYLANVPVEVTRGAHLLIVPHENRFLPIFLSLKRRFPDRHHFALFGHGPSLRRPFAECIENALRSWMVRQVDWYFAYTSLSVDGVAAGGFPRERVICLNNTIDVTELAAWKESIRHDELEALRSRLKIRGDHVAVFLGSLSKERRLPFLFEAAEKMREQDAGFELVIVGDGALRGDVRKFAVNRPWVHWVGARHDREKALYCRLGKVMLNPGMVGLNIIDSLALGIPMLTTDCKIHSPEIAYLENGRNGFMTANRLDEYVACAGKLFTDDALRRQVAGQAMEDAKKYTLEQMVENFANGVLRAVRSKG